MKTEPLVVKFLRGKTFADLEEKHAVKARPCANFKKFSLNYDQIKVKNGDPVAEQCRGLIIRCNNDLDASSYMTTVLNDIDVVAWPMNRFYNLGDEAAHPVDWSDPKLRVFEKLDGTMCILYFDRWNDQWHIATRSIPEADLPIYGQTGDVVGDHTFASLFRRAAEETLRQTLAYHHGFDNWVRTLNTAYTYVFELTTPLNRVVVRYDNFRVTLLAVKETRTGQEVDVTSARAACGPVVPEHAASWASLNEPRSLVKFVNEANPAALEGAVAIDSQFRRVKIKNKAWVLSSRAKDLITVSKRGALQAIINGSIDDVITLVEKDIADELRKMQQTLVAYIQKVDQQFLEWKAEAAGDRKKFAELALSSQEWAAPYFQLLDGRAPDFESWLIQCERDDRLGSTMLDSILGEMSKGSN